MIRSGGVTGVLLLRRVILPQPKPAATQLLSLNGITVSRHYNPTRPRPSISGGLDVTQILLYRLLSAIVAGGRGWPGRRELEVACRQERGRACTTLPFPSSSFPYLTLGSRIAVIHLPVWEPTGGVIMGTQNQNGGGGASHDDDDATLWERLSPVPSGSAKNSNEPH